MGRKRRFPRRWASGKRLTYRILP